MARLILEDGERTRRFKLGTGKLTLGSGEQATLRLESDDVAEVHAEIESKADGAVLRLRPGVTPARVGGRQRTGEIPLEHGQVVRIGGVALSVEYEDRPAPKRPAPVGERRAGRSSVQRRRRTASQGMPTWLLLLLIVVGGAFAFYFGRQMMSDATGDSFSARAVELRYEEYMDDGDYLGAEKVLQEFEGRELSEQWQERVREMKDDLDRLTSSARLDALNARGTKWMESQLKSFQANRLNPPKRPEARVFMRRAQWFEETFPHHPELDWVERMKARYAPIANLADDPTFEDLAFEVKSYTWAKPRDYKAAFAAIEDFLEHAGPEERTQALQLKAEKEAEQREHFDEQITDAAIQYDFDRYPDKFSPSAVVEILVQMTMTMNDPELADDAARRLVAMEEADLLKSYKKQRPYDFERLMENDIVREWVEAQGWLD